MKTKRIYLDFAASTPIDPGVLRLMNKISEDIWGNPSSIHAEGEAAKEVLENSREKIARILNCQKEEVYFTSGGTESGNLAIQGIVSHFSTEGRTPHIILSSLEHPAVLEVAENLSKQGKLEISLINPGENGIINPESIYKELRLDTILVCLMHGNNEIGTIQPVHKVSNLIKKFREENKNKTGPYLLVDMGQGPLFEDVSLSRFGANVLLLDGSKIYGPRGIGVMAIKRNVKISPVIFGGGQERGLRPGTENAISAAGLSLALEICAKNREKDKERITKLREDAIDKILKEIPGSSLNGDRERRLPNNINVCLPNQDSEFLVIKLDTLGFSVSSASACSNLKSDSLSGGSSYVIESLGRKDCASSSLRITLGRETSKRDLDKFIKALKGIVN